MISIDIFLLSISTSTEWLHQKNPKTNRQKTEKPLRKTMKVNKIAFIEGTLYALPLSTSSYWIKQTFMGEELSSSLPVTFLLQHDSRSCLMHRHMIKEQEQCSHPLKIVLCPQVTKISPDMFFSVFFWLQQPFKLFRKLASSAQKPGVFLKHLVLRKICIFIALFNMSTTSQPTWPCYEFANYCSLNSSCQDSGLLCWFCCWCFVWSLVQ